LSRPPRNSSRPGTNDLSETHGVFGADEIELVNWDDAHSEQVPTPPVPERIRHGISLDDHPLEPNVILGRLINSGAGRHPA
jgi:hypothetical protein